VLYDREELKSETNALRELDESDEEDDSEDDMELEDISDGSHGLRKGVDGQIIKEDGKPPEVVKFLCE
jgi:hypothetical protein